MRTVNELLDLENPAFPILERWAKEAEVPVELLPPSTTCDAALLDLQVTTRSILGAVVHGTGGILVDRGWLRMLGSGHERLSRTVPTWNAGRSAGFLLFADDAVGGFFAINGGALGDDTGMVYYLAPDTLEWESLGVKHSSFVQWAFTLRVRDFYNELRWDGWEEDVSSLHGDSCFNFYPFLNTEQSSTRTSSRKPVPVAEQYAFNAEARAPGT